MRHLRNFNTGTLTKVVTAPTYLVELGFDPVLYLSSGKETKWDGKVWEAAPIQVSAIDSDATGSQSISLTFANQNRDYGGIVLSQRTHGRYVRCWVAYESGRDPILFADGIMDGASVGAQVKISVISRSTYYGSTPRIICAPPLMNHLPPDGTVISFGSTKVVIQSR